jgi:hypothetical protein
MPRKAASPKLPPEERDAVLDGPLPQVPVPKRIAIIDPPFNLDALPNLAGVATADLVEKIVPQGGGFSASYINWSRTMHLLRLHAPGWMPELLLAPDGGYVHRAPVGGFLMIYFRNQYTKAETAAVPQAIMDNKNNSVPWERISARDITDSHRRGLCMAAAMTFGLAYELWAKLPLENGYAPENKPEPAEVPSLSDYVAMINAAANVPALREVFAESWQAHRLPASRATLKQSYDARMDVFDAKEEAAPADPTPAVYAPDDFEDADYPDK